MLPVAGIIIKIVAACGRPVFSNINQGSSGHCRATGWWLTYPLTNMSSSVGMMTFPIYGAIKFMFQTANQASTANHLQTLLAGYTPCSRRTLLLKLTYSIYRGVP